MPAGQYPGIKFIEIEKNWSAYSIFKLDVHNPDAEPLLFHIRIDDQESKWEYGNRYDRVFVLQKGTNHIVIPFAEMKTNVSQRILDARKIEHLMFVIPSNDRKRTFCIDNIRLE